LLSSIVFNGSIKTIILSTLALLFCGSKTALVTATAPLLYIYIKVRRRQSAFVMAIFASLVLITFANIYVRGFQSIIERFAMFYAALGQENLMWGKGLGAGTLSIHTLSIVLPAYKVQLDYADSLYLSLLMQGGIWLLFTMLTMTMYIFAKSNAAARVCIATYLMLGFGMASTEIWPFNIIVFALLGWLIKKGGVSIK